MSIAMLALFIHVLITVEQCGQTNRVRVMASFTAPRGKGGSLECTIHQIFTSDLIIVVVRFAGKLFLKRLGSLTHGSCTIPDRSPYRPTTSRPFGPS